MPDTLYWVVKMLTRFHKNLLAVLLLLVGVAMAKFMVPGKTEREHAVGSLTGLPIEMKRAYTDQGEFAALPNPGPGDWLSQHQENGQTFGQYVRSRPNIPAFEKRILYIQPIGKFDAKTAPSMDVLKQYTEAYYYPMTVRILPTIREGGIRSRMNGGRKQLLTTDILNLLQRRLPGSAYSVLGLTMTDLYAGANWNFVFGQARIKGRVGVFSFARYHPSWHGENSGDADEVNKLVLRRAAKVLTHETGHMFGIRHCIHYHCNMNGANHLVEADASPLHLCPVCLRKMQHAVKFSPVARYKKLLAFYQKYGLKEDADWVAKRIKWIEGG